jgi:cytochrome c nitrite reductase small subunit
MAKKNLTLLVLVSGITLGIGLFTFSFADGLSYFTDQPEACANCHIMNETFDHWTKGPHHLYATCQDCHISNEFFRGFAQKGSDGFRHAYAFTFGKPGINLTLSKDGKKRVMQACVGCHNDLFSDGSPIHNTTAEPTCLNCHKDIAH